MDALKLIAADSVKEQAPEFNVGDTIRIDVNIREGERERIQQFEGTVIARKGSGVGETFTVRRVSYGVGVERVFPLHSPNVKNITVVRKGRVRRARPSMVPKPVIAIFSAFSAARNARLCGSV